MIYKLLALALMAAFYACYFGKAVSQRKKGVSTMHLGSGKSGAVRNVEYGVLFASILTPVAELVSIFSDSSMLPSFFRGLGVCLGAVGVSFFVAAVITMRDSWRAGVAETDQTDLVTGGIFSVSRNPAFLGFYLHYVGILLTFFHPVLLIVTLFAMWMFHLQITKVEEPFLHNAFGDDYANYAKKVCRYLGRR